MGNPPERREIAVAELRQRFNDGQYWQRATAGELRQEVKRSAPARPEADQVQGTVSQTVHYYNARGEKVAVVHQYLQPDGTIGASGRPDPKMLLENGIVFVPRHDGEGRAI